MSGHGGKSQKAENSLTACLRYPHTELSPCEFTNTLTQRENCHQSGIDAQDRSQCADGHIASYPATIRSLIPVSVDNPIRIPQSPPNRNGIDTLIGSGMRIEGDIATTGVLRVQGTILGNVSCDAGPNGFLVVDSAGAVTGTVNATHVAVKGRVIGPVQSSQSIEIHQGATVVGNVSFKEIAIHAGGIVEGLLNPAVVPDQVGSLAEDAHQVSARPGSPELPMPPMSGAGGRGGWLTLHPGSTRRIGMASALVIVLASIAWMVRDFLVMNRPADVVALGTTASSRAPADPKAPTDGSGEHRSDPKAADADAAPLVPSLSVDARGTTQAAPPDPQRKDKENVVSVRGANPSRPAGVFLLISNEPSILYKKKLGDRADGTRISTAQGEKVSIAIAPDELIRVAEGRDVVILYQGKKVSRNIIEGDSWISFVPR